MSKKTNKKRHLDTKMHIAKEVSEELNISVEEVLYIVNSVFVYLKFIMKNGYFESLRIPYFGLFRVNPYTVHKKKHRKLYDAQIKLEKYDKDTPADNCGC